MFDYFFLVHGTIISTVAQNLPLLFSTNYYIDTIIRVMIYYLLGLLVALIVGELPLINRVLN